MQRTSSAGNPDWKFAAKKYKIVRTTSGGQKITYTDFQDGREYTIELSPEWPRPWTIYEVEILSSNALVEIWRATNQPNENLRRKLVPKSAVTP